MADEQKQREITVERGGQKIQVRMDTSDLDASYANVANVWGTREEIMVDFGMNGVRRAPQTEVVLKMNRRLVMSPYTAKRLSIMLSQAMDRYEKTYGSIDVARRQQAPDISHSSEEIGEDEQPQ